MIVLTPPTKPRLYRLTLALMVIGQLLGSAEAVPTVNLQSSQQLDQTTQTLLAAMLSGDLEQAERLASQLNKRFPDFALGQLLHAELQASRAGQLSLLTGDHQVYGQPLMDLLLEAQIRLQQAAPPARQLPAELIQIGGHIKHIIVVDLQHSELYLYGNTASNINPRLLKRHYIASGSAGFGKQREGDLKTPLGIYSIKGRRSDASLPDLYGSGALILDYPNPLDKLLGRTGSGIWLHGVPHRQRSRAPRSSEGCVTMANDYLNELSERIDPDSTTVILGGPISWSDIDQQMRNKERFQELFKQYKDAWIQHRTADLQALYHASALPRSLRIANVSRDAAMPDSQRPLDALAAVSATSISILRNPSLSDNNQRSNHVIMDFELNHGGQITLYWAKDGTGEWRIVHETVSTPGA